MFKRILIANRGEIACRIARTTKNMGIQSIAIYSEPDAFSPHVLLANNAFYIGKAPSKESYLDIQAIIRAALESGAEAIHPGYGFLSENPALAEACTKAGIVFIGPPVSAMKAMASKQFARQMLENSGVPLTPGYHGLDQSYQNLLSEAEKIGFPVLLKAANGGGGKGMRAVKHKKDFQAALEGARRESLASFGDDTMIIEKLVIHPRHIEVQIMADNFGNILHFFERDCSIQRRHQKIIEEAPATGLSETLRLGLTKAACTVAKSIDYRNAGTIEFLVDTQNQTFYFMEMNTRLQVEHPVTEMITGLDLVELQIKIAADEPLPLTQKDIQKKGHAIECRIYAEDPQRDFMPSTGNIHFLKEPVFKGIRIDSGILQGSDISQYYDPLIAKLIAFGNTREEALLRLEQSLSNYAIGGIKTNIPFLKAICQHEKFRTARFSTQFLEEEMVTLPDMDTEEALYMAAAYDYLQCIQHLTDPLYKDTFGFQIHLKGAFIQRYVLQNKPYALQVEYINQHSCKVNFNDKKQVLNIRLNEAQLLVETTTGSIKGWVEATQNTLTFYTEKGTLHLKREEYSPHVVCLKNSQLTAPMPGTVVAILKKAGEHVKAGDGLMVLEAMKMEHTIHAPTDGILTEIFYDVGAKVSEGTELLAMDE